MIINIFGRRGSGKTTLIKGNISQFPGPVAIIDVLGNFNEDEYFITEDIPEFIDWLKDWKKDPDEAEKLLVLRPSDPTMALDYVSSALWHLEGGTLVLDEVDAFNYSDAPCFDQLIRYGRNRRVHILTGCRRPAEISRNITAGSNRIYIMRTQEPRDIEYFNKTILGEKSEVLMRLDAHHGLLVDHDEGSISEFKFNEKGEIFILNSEPFQS